MEKYSKVLLRFAAVFALVGAFIGSQMAGSGAYDLKPIHAHILVVGWLSLFAFAVYYKVFTPAKTVIATLHVWSAIIGAIGLTSGMWLYFIKPFNVNDIFATVFFIVGGSILMLSFIFFLILTFMKTEESK